MGLISLTEILTRAKLNPLDTNTTPKQFPLFTTNFYILSPHAISVKPSSLTTRVILFYTRQESFRHFSDICQGHLFLPSQPSLHVKLQISKSLQMLPQHAPLTGTACFASTQRSESLNPGTRRATKRYKFCSQEQFALISSPSAA